MKKITFTILLTLFTFVFSYSQVCQVFITHVINGNQVQYAASSPDNPTSWSWFFNGGNPSTSNLQNPVINYAFPGLYISECTVSGGPNSCSPSLSSGQDSVTILSSGIIEVKRIDGIYIFNRNSIPTFEISSNSKQDVFVQLFDMSGKLIDLVFEGALYSGNNTIQMRPIGLPDGNYILQIISTENQFTRKFRWKN